MAFMIYKDLLTEKITILIKYPSPHQRVVLMGWRQPCLTEYRENQWFGPRKFDLNEAEIRTKAVFTSRCDFLFRITAFI